MTQVHEPGAGAATDPGAAIDPGAVSDAGAATDPAANDALGPLRQPERLRGTLRLPSDKSIAHRALIANAVAYGRAIITIRAPGADILSTVSALRSLGASIGERATDEPDTIDFLVDGSGTAGSLGVLEPGSAYCGNAGTTFRLLCGLAASGPGRIALAGDASLSQRPMERVAEPLRRMGASVTTTEGHPPVVVDGARPLTAAVHALPIASAQVLGAICLAGLAADGLTSVALPGPTRDHTERLLVAMGAGIHRDAGDHGATITTVRGPSALHATDVRVPGDISSGAVWLVAASLHPDAEIRLEGVSLNPTRMALVEILSEMGAFITVEAAGRSDAGEPVGDLLVRSAPRLRPIRLGPERVPALIDELPLLAVAMAAADATSEIRGAAELRLKESDRIGAMAQALHAVGARIEELPDGWRIAPGRPSRARVMTHGDHRVAMAMAVAAWTGVAAEVSLDDPTCVAVSYPSFWSDAASIGGIGPIGSTG